MSVTVDQQDSLALVPSTPPTISPGAWFWCGGRRPELEWSVMTNSTADPYWNSSCKQSWRASNSVCGRRQWIFSISVITHNSGRFPITLPNFYNWFSLSIPVVPCASPLLFTCMPHCVYMIAQGTKIPGRTLEEVASRMAIATNPLLGREKGKERKEKGERRREKVGPNSAWSVHEQQPRAQRHSPCSQLPCSLRCHST